MKVPSTSTISTFARNESCSLSCKVFACVRARARVIAGLASTRVETKLYNELELGQGRVTLL
eukprot:687494-Amphidinium_carterae.1